MTVVRAEILEAAVTLNGTGGELRLLASTPSLPAAFLTPRESAPVKWLGFEAPAVMTELRRASGADYVFRLSQPLNREEASAVAVEYARRIRERWVADPLVTALGPLFFGIEE